jgi:hypothetical protein
MKKWPNKFIAGIMMIVAFTSCTKIDGHVIGSDGTTTGSTTGTIGVPGGGTGPVAVGALNTVIFRVNNDTTYTLSSPTYKPVFSVITNPILNTPATSVIMVNPVNYDSFSLIYPASSTGTYVAQLLAISLGQKTLSNSLTTETVKITSQSATALQGTFDGYMIPGSVAKDSVRVVGSFNLQP